MSHTFEREVPRYLDRPPQLSGNSETDLDVFASAEGLIFNVTRPILGSHAGTLQLGVTDQMVTQELTVLNRSILWGLGLCTMIGTGLALLLTHILTRPIQHLVQAANRIRKGDFETRSKVFSAGHLHAGVARSQGGRSRAAETAPIGDRRPHHA